MRFNERHHGIPWTDGGIVHIAHSYAHTVENGLYLIIFLYLFIFILRWMGKKKLMLTTPPRIFTHIVRQFNSIAFAIQLFFWRVLQCP